LSHRLLSFDGNDAASFLQGYLTCDTSKLDSRTALACAFTNLKGRVVANGWVWGQATAVRMLLSASLTDVVADFLKPYLNFSKTKLTVANTPPIATLAATNSAPEAAEMVLIGTYGAVLEAPPDSALHQREDLSAQWLEHCIAAHEVVVTAKTSGIYLPQMLGLTKIGAVAFDKGCYLGQEIVARAEHRGEVKRKLCRASHNAKFELEPGCKLVDKAGKIQATLICASATAALLVSSDSPSGTQRWYVEDKPIDSVVFEQIP